MTVLAGMFSFRVVLALVVSSTVTSTVSGPLAYQAYKAREERPSGVAAQPPERPAGRDEAVGDPDHPPPPEVTSTTTTLPMVVTTNPESPTTTTTAVEPRGEPIGPEGLYAANRPDHTDAIALEGAAIAGTVWVFFDGEHARSVRFWIDDPDGAGQPDAVAAEPFDLDPAGFDFTVLDAGPHTLLAEVTTTEGTTFRRLATFRVIEAN